METEKIKELLGVQPRVPVCITEGFLVGEDRPVPGRGLTEAAVRCWGHHSFWVFPALGMRENRVVLAFVWDLFGCIYVLSQRIGRPAESRLWNSKMKNT